MRILCSIILSFLVCASAEAQTKVSPRPTPTPTLGTETAPPKKNSRAPQADAANSETQQKSFDYFWEFSQPKFQTKRIIIRHDVNGKGDVVFERAESQEAVTEPIAVSAMALERITSALKSLNFLESKEDYQYEKDYSHLGNQTFRFRSAGKGREVRINYTTNAQMAAVLDEYRKIGNQAMWTFDVTLARDMHPLDTPGQIDALDSLLKRNEISDPQQLLPFLKEISVDERFPLIARNHAARLIKKIESGR